jgi:hypothetical protein
MINKTDFYFGTASKPVVELEGKAPGDPSPSIMLTRIIPIESMPVDSNQ